MHEVCLAAGAAEALKVHRPVCNLWVSQLASGSYQCTMWVE